MAAVDPDVDPPDGDDAPVRRVDARGHRCPIPTLRLQRALEGAPPGTIVVLLADDPMARIDAPHFCAQQGHELLAVQTEIDGMSISVRKRARPAPEDASLAQDLTDVQDRSVV